MFTGLLLDEATIYWSYVVIKLQITIDDKFNIFHELYYKDIVFIKITQTRGSTIYLPNGTAPSL